VPLLSLYTHNIHTLFSTMALLMMTKWNVLILYSGAHGGTSVPLKRRGRRWQTPIRRPTTASPTEMAYLFIIVIIIIVIIQRQLCMGTTDFWPGRYNIRFVIWFVSLVNFLSPDSAVYCSRRAIIILCCATTVESLRTMSCQQSYTGCTVEHISGNPLLVPRNWFRDFGGPFVGFRVLFRFPGIDQQSNIVIGSPGIAQSQHIAG